MSTRDHLLITHAHPKGLWYIAILSALTCYGFGIINSLLILYTTGTLHIDSGQAYLLSATYNSLLFTLPLIGGYAAEQLGFKRALLFGIALNIIGLCLISIQNTVLLYLGLGTFTAGVSLFVPTYLVLQGKLYAKNDKRRESAYTISYIIMNVGFLAAALSGGYLVKYVGYPWCFRFATVVTLCAYIIYYFGKHHIKPYHRRRIEPQVNWQPYLIWATFIIGSILLSLLSAWLISHAHASDDILFIVILVITVWLMLVALRHQDRKVKKKLIAFLVLSYISIGFWALYTLEPTLLTIFIKSNVNRSIFGFEIPPSSFYGLDPFFIITLGAVFSYLWLRLAKANKNPELPTKFTLSLFTMGSAFFILILGIHFADSNGLSNMLWIVIAYALFSIAELLISPIGYSMVGRLSPEGMEGRLMGVWQLFSGFAGALSGYLALFAVVPRNDTATASNPIYVNAFAKISFMTLVLALVSLLLIPYIKRLIRR